MWKLSRRWRLEIERVDVVKETAQRVTIRETAYSGGTVERSYAKRSEHSSFHPTWEEAHSEAVKIAEAEACSARRALEQANGKLGNVKGMKKPEAE